jgi:hypothetical protein
MVRDGTARRSESSWSSALHLVPKKDNGVHAAIIAHSTPEPFPTATQYLTSKNTLTSYLVTGSILKSTR